MSSVRIDVADTTTSWRLKMVELRNRSRALLGELFDPAIASKKIRLGVRSEGALVGLKFMYFDCVEYDSDAIQQAFRPQKPSAERLGASLLSN